jgi:hypothetical protein
LPALLGRRDQHRVNKAAGTIRRGQADGARRRRRRPVRTLAKAVELARREPIDAAMLDVNIRSEKIDPVVDTLRGRGVLFVLATGYGAVVAAGKDGEPVVEKPFTRDRLQSVATSSLKSSAQSRMP